MANLLNNEFPLTLDVGIIVCIPCYNETNAIATLQSLFECEPYKSCRVEVIVLVNEPRNSSENVRQRNKRTYEELTQWQKKNTSQWIRFLIAYKVLEEKHAGVGLARKLCMDEAYKRFSRIGNSDRGIIVSLDADTSCKKNYLKAIEEFYRNNPKTKATTIYFEHPFEDKQYPAEIQQAIIAYETYLRYFVNYMRWCGHPYAYHTLGSAFTVRADTYHEQGGMNKRKAGEDFYFLQKLIPLGDFGEITTTTMYPSPRVSEKVPFGTGKAVKKFLQEKILKVYNPLAFRELKKFLAVRKLFYKLHFEKVKDKSRLFSQELNTFLIANHWLEKIKEINENCSSLPSFEKRFFRAFNMFFWIKFLNFLHKNYLEKIPVKLATTKLLKDLGTYDNENDEEAILKKLRKIDSTSGY